MREDCWAAWRLELCVYIAGKEKDAEKCNTVRSLCVKKVFGFFWIVLNIVLDEFVVRPVEELSYVLIPIAYGSSVISPVFLSDMVVGLVVEIICLVYFLLCWNSIRMPCNFPKIPGLVSGW